MIKRIMDILDIPRNGVKDELVARLMEWLEKPKDSGSWRCQDSRHVPSPAPPPSSQGGGKREGGGDGPGSGNIYIESS